MVLDVVYNHLGPEGNMLLNSALISLTSIKRRGARFQFRRTYSDEVVRYFLENAIGWLADFHIDGFAWMQFTRSWTVAHGHSWLCGVPCQTNVADDKSA